MTRYTVIWRPYAQGTLANLWVEHAERQSIADAANLIDRELSIDPLLRGEEGPEGFRRLTIPPLTVQFAVEELDRKVLVATVRLVGN